MKFDEKDNTTKIMLVVVGLLVFGAISLFLAFTGIAKALVSVVIALVSAIASLVFIVVFNPVMIILICVGFGMWWYLKKGK